MYRSTGITVVFLGLISTTGCVSPYGTPNNTGTGALAGGIVGAVAGGLAGGHHAAGAAVFGGLTGAVVGGLIGHAIDEDERYRQPPTVYYQQAPTVYYQQPATVQPQPQVPVQAPSSAAVPPLTVDDIKALDSAGVRKETIIAEIESSRSVYTRADIDALLQSNPHVDPAIIECMKKTGGR